MITSDISAVAAAVAAGDVVAICTDTVYGLACDPRHSATVERIYEIKRRPADLELTLLGANAAGFDGLVETTAEWRALAQRYWPGPLSLIAPCGATRLAVPRRGTTLSVRVPGHDLLRSLLELTGPLATTSANRHGQPAAATAAAVEAQLEGDVGLVLDGGRGGGIASTIINCAVSPPQLVREGPIGTDDWQAVIAELTHGGRA